MPNHVMIIKLSVDSSGLNGFEYILVKLEDNNTTARPGGGGILF